VVIGGREKIIIDPGLWHLWPFLEKNIQKELPFETRDFAYVVHTHCHPDHMDAGAYLEERYGLVQAMSREEKEFLDNGGEAIFRWMGLDPPTGTVGKYLEEGSWELADKVLNVYLTPGHSPGGVCIHYPEKKTLIVGDLIFARGFGRVDLAGGDPSELVRSVRRMAALPDVDTIIPGHGPSIVGRERVEKNYEIVFKLLEENGFA
jgi:glyoxylase-like metal-dependent hydrolase (beta-lactamase superfamily II)